MNSLIIPPSPNWYLNNILACAPDDTIIYGARCDLVIIKPKNEENEAADVKIITIVHSQRVISVNINANWGSPNKLAVCAGEDQVIRLFDVDTCNLQLSHKGHTVNSEKIVNATFSGNDRVVSCGDSGFIIIWKLSTNELTSLKNIFGYKVKISSMSPCPHASYLFAFGTEYGLIFIADLRKNGKIVHKLRGHDKSIVSLSWCPAPFNVFPDIRRRKNVKVKEKSKEDTNVAECGVEIVKITNNDNKTAENAATEKNNEENEDSVENGGDKNNETQSMTTCEELEDSIISKFSSRTNSIPEIVITVIEDKCETEEMLHEAKIKETKQNGQGDSVDVTECDKNDIINHPMHEGGDTSNSAEEFQNTSSEISSNVECEEDSNTCKIANGDSSKMIHPDKNAAVCCDITTESQIADDTSETEQKETEKEYFLASSSRTGVVCIWKAGFSGRFYTELHTSSKLHFRKKKEHERTWVAVCWVSPHILLSSSPSGELILWNLLQPRNDGIKPHIVHHDHSGNVFTIVSNLKTIKTLDELHCNDNARVWTVGQDRLLLNSSVGVDRKNYFCLPTVGGNIFCFVSSPLDPTRIAIGFGDGITKVWDLSRPHCQYITMINLWQRTNGRVMSLAWHPTKELLLAYGTCEGRVGTVDVYNTAKPPTLLTQFFKSEIFHLEWGPFQNDPENHALYVYANSQLVVYNTNKPLNEPNVLISENVMSFSWKSDYSVLAVGTKNGEVFFYRMDMSQLSTVFLLKRVRNLAWHPMEMDEKSANWLAITTNENVFYVYNCEVVSDVNVNSTLIATLDGHNKRVNAVAWSLHEYNKIVSVGEDGIALVWDVETQQVLSSFVRSNCDPITAVLWSPLDKDFIMIGGRDNCIRIWKISEHPPLKEDVLVQRKKIVKAPKATIEDESDVHEETTVKDKKKPDNILKSFTQLHNTNLFDDCKRLLNSHLAKNNEGASSEVDCLDIFKGFEEMYKLLDFVRKSHDVKKKPHCEQMVSLWMGDITESIKDAINNGNVSPWLISMAPMASPRLWFQACEAYVNQLIEKAESDPLEIVSYLLACHKVEEAVNVLIDALMFREALAITKVRLPQNNILVNKIFDKWILHCNYTGQYELAAQIYIHLKQYEEAAKILYKRSDAKTLGLALELAEKTNNKDLHEAVLARYKIFVDKEIVDSFPNLSNENEKVDTNGNENCVEKNGCNNTVEENTVPDSIENTLDETGNSINKTEEQQN